MMFPKPKDVKRGSRTVNGIETMRDGREICRTETAWQKRRGECWTHDQGRCVKCGKSVTLNHRYEGDRQASHIDHVKCRGLGGGFRDDRIVKPDGKRGIQTLCHDCHGGKHGWI